MASATQSNGTTTTLITSFDSQHQDMIHDAQMDYYGRRLATCSSDKTVKIFEVGAKGQQKQVAELQGHEAPVWQVAWAHPKFGVVLASCGYDRKVIVWREEQGGQWRKIHEYSGHELSVNAIAWAPHEHGLVLATASSDAHVSVLSWKAPNDWHVEKFQAHLGGVNAVAWAPTGARLATGGSDGAVRLWIQEDQKWRPAGVLEAHRDWVRDVAWAPNVGMLHDTLASCAQDGQVIVWSRPHGEEAWSKTPLTREPFKVPVWRVSWSLSGHVLAVSSGDNDVTLWRQGLDNSWAQTASLGS